ncbi:MAG: hypothetical protein JWR09_5740 [Mucilaginibacter sp.]|nr:hypothetical protein [Mucilaginibacter sp.]
METAEIKQLYKAYIEAWNKRDARAMANLTTENCVMIGFDGNRMFGRTEIVQSISQIFLHHQTAKYVTIIKGIIFLAADVAVLNSVVGMVPPGANDIKPEVNAIQVLTAKHNKDKWLIAVFQNTPAAFHGRPELSEALTNELRNKLTGKVDE